MKDYAKWFSHNAIKAKIHAKHSSPPPTLSPASLELLRAWSAKKTLTESDLEMLLRELAALKTSAPAMTITLAAPAGKELKQTLVDWCRHNIAPNIMVSFQFNASLLGGMVVSYKSRVFDWSFRRQILESRQTFAEVLRRV
jgi:F0F1-type ATP synthase delta subunit